MAEFSLRSRAISFAFCVGAVALILSLLAGAGGGNEPETITRALVVAIVCGIMSWAATERAMAGIADAVDAATTRLTAAAHGDLVSATPAVVGGTMPHLSEALDSLFAQVRTNLDSVHNLAMFDPVTSLANRTNFRREAERMMRDLPAGTLSALLFIDLDNFKAVNDSLGHAIGDQLLSRVGNRLRAIASDGRGHAGRPRAEPLIGRLAGDEFTVFVPQPENRDEAERIAHAALFALAEPFELSGNTVQIGASIGIALRPHHGFSLTALMRAADVAMYHAKQSGRGQVQFYSDALAEKMADKLLLEQQLRIALDEDQFSLVFQPQIAMASGAIVAAEALLRWNHPTQGLRLPGSFIACAEDCGLIVEIGDWVIDAVAETVARWDMLGVGQRLAINISPRQIERPDFFPRLRRAMAERGAPARLLELEITESLAMQCGDAVIEQIAAIRRDGATIAIDDFGTGYSNIGRLKDLPVDLVKLDRSLTADIATSAEDRTVAHAVISLIHGLGHRVIAEGVENRGQRDVLRAIGCDMIQGYAVAEPMAEAAFLDWVRVERAALAM